MKESAKKEIRSFLANQNGVKVFNSLEDVNQEELSKIGVAHASMVTYSEGDVIEIPSFEDVPFGYGEFESNGYTVQYLVVAGIDQNNRVRKITLSSLKKEPKPESEKALICKAAIDFKALANDLERVKALCGHKLVINKVNKWHVDKIVRRGGLTTIFEDKEVPENLKNTPQGWQMESLRKTDRFYDFEIV